MYCKKIDLRRIGFIKTNCRRILCAAGLLLTVAAASAQAWPEITPQTRPGTRWWWPGSAVDAANLRQLIEEYSKAGIGSVEITPIYGVQDNQRNEIQYLTPHWMVALRETQSAASDNSIYVDMNQGTGWPFGGPEVTVDQAACKAIFLVDTVAPGAAPTKVVAEKDRPMATLIASSRRSLPDGSEEVIRLYQGRTRQKVKRAAPGGEGYVIDHFDRDAVKAYLDKFDCAFSSTGTAWPRTFFNDSYEVYGANWTPSLLDEFESRRGYKLQEHLPELLGLVDDGNSVLADYRETLAELLYENFTLQWAEWCAARGIKTRNQAHGSPGNLIDLYAAVDIPECESFGITDFGIRGLRRDPGYTRPNDSDAAMLKYASSAAHVTGKPLVSSETLTWLTEHFRTSLAQMKPEIDLMLANGVNNIFYHGTMYSPKEVKWPGWKFYASVDISPTNTIWRDINAMNDYVSRAQSMMREGVADNDFLVYVPVRDMWRLRRTKGEKGLLMPFDIHGMKKVAPDFIRTVNAIDSLGYGCDYISEKLLLGVTPRDSILVTEAGVAYKALILPEGCVLSDTLAAKIDSLSAHGARIIRGVDGALMAQAAVPEMMRTELGLSVMRRADADGYHYFIANLTPDDVYQPVPLAVDFEDAVWFDPISGAIFAADNYNGEIEMRFRSGESRILRLYDHAVDKSGMPRLPGLNETIEIDLSNNKWQLTFPTADPPITKTLKLKYLEPWTNFGEPQLNEYAGTGVYTTSFTMKGDDFDRDWYIDLGDVRESARVYVNGTYAGTAWAVPYTLKLNGLLQRGKNYLRIEVTNLPANRIAAMDRRQEPWRIMQDINMVDINYHPSDYSGWAKVPSGLNSTVRLIRY